MTSIVRGLGRPKKYKLADGRSVPGTTTITNRFKESGGLIHWAWKEGMEGRDYRQTRDAAADAGTIAHDLIEQEIHESIPAIAPAVAASVGDEICKRAMSALENFRDWKKQSKLVITHTELPLISEKHEYGGTIDAVGTVNGDLVIPDWKSSNSVYADYLYQVAGGYVTLWEEHFAEKVHAVHLLRIDKEFGSFAHYRWGRDVIDHAIQGFLLMRELFDTDKILKRAVG